MIIENRDNSVPLAESNDSRFSSEPAEFLLDINRRIEDGVNITPEDVIQTATTYAGTDKATSIDVNDINDSPFTKIVKASLNSKLTAPLVAGIILTSAYGLSTGSSIIGNPLSAMRDYEKAGQATDVLEEGAELWNNSSPTNIKKPFLFDNIQASVNQSLEESKEAETEALRNAVINSANALGIGAIVAYLLTWSIEERRKKMQKSDEE